MRSVIRSLVFAAAGFAAASLYRQWSDERRAAPRRHRHPLENWENEGGALPEIASLERRPAAAERTRAGDW